MAPEVSPNVLVVERDTATTRLVLETCAARGIRGTVVADARAAIERLSARGGWDLVIADWHAPGGGGREVVRFARGREPELPVVLVSDQASVEAAVEAVREGGTDFLVRPLARAAVERLLARLVPNRPVPLAGSAAADRRCLYRIVGRSPRLLETIAVARKAAPTSVPVLILGETGTGKELIAHLVHRASRRAAGPYVRLNCAALPQTLLESELFGHERGAFTGAIRDRKGRFELAHGGTLLLDEVTETGPRLQAELLRVLEQQDFERVGGSEPVRVNVRIIGTTNRDLVRLVQQGEFRPDLYWRLAGMRVHVPPLRRRVEDIPDLVWHFVNEFAPEARRAIAELDPDMMALFSRYDWPGNVRQLRSVVRTAMVLGTSPVLSLAEAPWLRAELLQGPSAPEDGGRHGQLAEEGLRLRDVERRAILEAVRLTDWHHGRAAALLGITDRTLRDKLRRYRQEGRLPGPARPGATAAEQPCAFGAPGTAHALRGESPRATCGYSPRRGTQAEKAAATCSVPPQVAQGRPLRREDPGDGKGEALCLEAPA
jgi:DNA-binding NtrC family response regulator